MEFSTIKDKGFRMNKKIALSILLQSISLFAMKDSVVTSIPTILPESDPRICRMNNKGMHLAQRDCGGKKINICRVKVTKNIVNGMA